jgi:hypothetical protein
MQWADATRTPSPRTLRQFAVLSLVVFGGLAAWRAWHGEIDSWTKGLAIAAVAIGLPGLIAPRIIRPVFTGWMIVAFPIGWTLSRVAIGLMFFLIFVPVALVFRMISRDTLDLRRRPGESSYWKTKPSARSSEEYLRQF